jgi:hypothetical protein
MQSSGQSISKITDLTISARHNLYNAYGATAMPGQSFALDLRHDQQTGTIDLDLHIKENGKEYLLWQQQYIPGADSTGKLKMTLQHLPDTLVSYLQNLGLPIHPLRFASEGKISADVTMHNNELWLDNIIATGAFIEAVGRVKLSEQEGGVIRNEVAFTIDKIDLDALSLTKNNNKGPFLIYETTKNFDLENHQLAMAIKVNNARISDQHKLHDCSFVGALDKGIFTISELSGGIDKHGMFQLYGEITQNDFRNMFEGQVSLVHDDLNDLISLFGDDVQSVTGKPIPFHYKSKLKFNAVSYILNQLELNVPDSSITGDVSLKLIGSNPKIQSDLKIEFLDLDNPNLPFLPRIFQGFAQTLLQTKAQNYNDYSAFIRQIKHHGNHILHLEQVKYDSQLYNDISSSIVTANSFFALKDLKLQTQHNKLLLDIAIDAKEIKPKVEINVKEGQIHTTALSAPGLLLLRDTILAQMDLRKIDFALKGRLDSVESENLRLANASFDIIHDANLLKINDISSEVFGGRSKVAGTILLTPYQLNLVYSLNSIMAKEFSNILPDSFRQPQGVFSANGMITTNGENMKEQLYNLYSDSDIIIHDALLANMSIDDFVSKLSADGYNVQNFTSDVKEMLLTGNTQVKDLKTTMILNRGVANFSSTLFKTINSSGTIAGSFNLYDFKIDLQGELSFRMKNYLNPEGSDIIKMDLSAKGMVLNPKKTAGTQKLLELLKGLQP